ncbi:hypothetical protein T05_1609 [Trichinella murrelli]|uniref:Uncharacterized protein n=1 Tax=Trichinella murrelli TaxID=144512 RepID=A0A0V0SP99_9BILA|nr:hypothetical protein T05_1609 [Trichinella murrelli]
MCNFQAATTAIFNAYHTLSITSTPPIYLLYCRMMFGSVISTCFFSAFEYLFTVLTGKCV